MIKVTIDWAGKKGLDNLIRYIQNDIGFIPAEGVIGEIADKAVNEMKATINNERRNPKRPDDKLVNAIGMEDLSPSRTELVIGIGNVAKLVAEAPYFELINDGGTYITKKTHVVPTTYFGDPGDGFVTFKEGSSHTITGIDYIGKALRNLSTNLDKGLKELGVKFLGGAANASK